MTDMHPNWRPHLIETYLSNEVTPHITTEWRALGLGPAAYMAGMMEAACDPFHGPKLANGEWFASYRP